jgi:hypothetical protein
MSSFLRTRADPEPSPEELSVLDTDAEAGVTSALEFGGFDAACERADTNGRRRWNEYTRYRKEETGEDMVLYRREHPSSNLQWCVTMGRSQRGGP